MNFTLRRQRLTNDKVEVHTIQELQHTTLLQPAWLSVTSWFLHVPAVREGLTGSAPSADTLLEMSL